jgi:hypothetical protein
VHLTHYHLGKNRFGQRFALALSPAVEPVVEMAAFVRQGSTKPAVEMAGFAKRKYRPTVSRLSPQFAAPFGAFAGRKRSNSLGRTSPGKYRSFFFGSYRTPKGFASSF